MFPFSFSPEFIAVVQTVVGALVLYFSVFTLAIVMWTFQDSRRRSRNWLVHILAAVLVLTFNLPGLVLYLLIRPAETLAQRHDRDLEEAAILQELEKQLACPRCKKAVREEFQFCPHCSVQLRKGCTHCGAALSGIWKACPYCGKATGPATTSLPAPAAAIAPLPEATTTALTEAAS